MLKWIRERLPAFIGTVFPERTSLAIAQGSDSGASHKAQGDACLHEGKLPKQRNGTEKPFPSIRPTQKHLSALVSLSMNYVGQYDDAERALERVIAIDPTNADAHYLLGKIAQISARTEEALQHFSATLQFDPKFEFAYRDLAGLLFQIGQIEKAEQIAKKGVEIFPQSVDFHFLLGNLYMEGRKFALAIASFQQTLTFAPNSAEVHKMLGDALRELGQTDEAMSSYRNALQIQPDLVEAQHNLATALQSLGRLDEAVAFFGWRYRSNPSAQKFISTSATRWRSSINLTTRSSAIGARWGSPISPKRTATWARRCDFSSKSMGSTILSLGNPVQTDTRRSPRQSG